MDEKLSIETLKPFQLIQKGLMTLSSENQRLELPESEVNTNRFGLPWSQFLVWCTLVDDVRTFFRDKLKEEESSNARM